MTNKFKLNGKSNHQHHTVIEILCIVHNIGIRAHSYIGVALVGLAEVAMELRVVAALGTNECTGLGRRFVTARECGTTFHHFVTC
jgi:hypothetical protein